MALDGSNDKQIPKGEGFDRLLLESIDEAFATLGESPKTAIYYYLDQKFELPRARIPKQIEEFSEALEKIFGLGAKHLEILIMKNLHRKTLGAERSLTKTWNASALTFSTYIKLQKELFRKRKSQP